MSDMDERARIQINIQQRAKIFGALAESKLKPKKKKLKWKMEFRSCSERKKADDEIA